MRQLQLIYRSAEAVSASIVFMLFAGCVIQPPNPKPANLATATATPAAASNTPVVAARSALSNTRQKVDHELYVNADCTTGGTPTVVVVTPAQNGVMWSEPESEYPLFTKENQRYECNKMSIPGTGVFYKSNVGFTGTDTASIHVIFPNGTFRDIKYTIVVE